MPYGPPGRPTPPPRKRRGGVTSLLLVIVFLVVGGLVKFAVNTGIDVGIGAIGPKPSTTYTPQPGTAPAATADNPLLTTANGTLVPASCDYAPWSTQVEKARAFFESAARCLEAAWKPVRTRPGMRTVAVTGVVRSSAASASVKDRTLALWAA